jgi:small-conductance mechanosensitive channel/CRP-like cAMP-binding protein
MTAMFSTTVWLLLAGMTVAIAWLVAVRRRIGEAARRRIVTIAIVLLAVTMLWIALPRIASLQSFAGIKPVTGPATRFIGSIWWLIFAVFAFMVIERYVWTSLTRRGVAVPKLLIDIVRAVVFILMVLGMISAAFEETITGLLAASGVFAVVMGFALQSTLADLFSGIAINLQHPYRVGDWIEVDGGTIGQVVEINWRATQLRSPQGNIVIFPNSKLAAAQIVNFNQPTPRHRNEITLAINAKVPPGAARDVLERAALKSASVLSDPPPTAQIKEFNYAQITYVLHFWTDGYSDFEIVRHDVANSVWYALDVLGLGTWCDNAESAATNSQAVRLVSYVDLFRDFDPRIRERIAGAMTSSILRPGQTIMREGEAGASVYIVELGVIDVRMSVQSHGEKTVARLGTGDFFGEMSLLTGEPRSATLVALCETKVWEVGRDVMEPILRENPALAERLGRVMARRQLANTMLIKSLTEQERLEAENSWPDAMLGRIRSFFSLPS